MCLLGVVCGGGGEGARFARGVFKSLRGVVSFCIGERECFSIGQDLARVFLGAVGRKEWARASRAAYFSIA